jgi:glycosyltransferase involved in cell wall biosynthesis
VRAPRVSVILPVFNRQDYLRETIATVFAQSIADWELVIADDGSDVATRSFLHTLESDARVRIVWGGHSGSPAVARNAALRIARGDYVAFLDSDDLWEPAKLERQLERLRLREDCHWCYCAFKRVDGAGRLLGDEATRPWRALEGSLFENILRGEASLRTPCVLAARELLAQAGDFDESLRDAEDVDVWLRLALHSPVALVDEPLVRVRIAPQSYTTRPRHARVDLIRVIEKLLERADGRFQDALSLEQARQVTLLAREYAESGKRGPALRTLARSIALSARQPRAWGHLARAIALTVLPGMR